MKFRSIWHAWFWGDASAGVEAALGCASECLAAMPADAPPAVRARLERAITVLARDEIFIAVAGLFKVGKSTLLNRLADWEILPSGDLPETGAPAFLRRRKPKAAVIRQRQGGSRAINADPSSVACETSLYEADGSRRSLDRLAKRVEIDAPGLKFDPRAVLIDLPGLRDTKEMDEIALDVAMESDLLIWVFRSEPAFSEQDAAFLSSLVSVCGSHTVQLALNVISRDSDGWPEFQTERLASHKAGITKYLPAMGLSQHHVDMLIVIDAKRICFRWFEGLFGETFGGKQLHNVLKSFSNKGDNQVKLGRLTRVASAIDDYRSWLLPTLADAESLYREQEARHNAFQQRLALRAKLREGLSRTAATAFRGLESDIADVGDSAAFRVSPVGYSAFKSVGEPLIAGAKTLVVARARALVSSIAALAANEEALPIDPSVNEAIVRAFAFGSNRSFTSPEEAIKCGITDEVGKIYTPEPKMSFGRVISWLKGKDKGVEDAVAEARLALQTRAQSVAKRTLAQEYLVQAAAMDALRLVPMGTAPPEPDRERLDLLRTAEKCLEAAQKDVARVSSTAHE